MHRLSNIRIGTKLAAMSALGILLVIGMLVSQIWGNAAVKSSNQAANQQQQIARDILAAKVAVAAMQIGGRETRLAGSKDELQKAIKRLEDGQATAHKWLDPLVDKLQIAENRTRVERAKALVDQFAGGLKGEIAAVIAEAIDIKSKQGDGATMTAEAAARIVSLNETAARIAREKTLPMTAEVESLLDQVDATAAASADSEIAAAAEQMSSTERVGFGIGATVILVMIGSAVFGGVSIARPLRRMAGVL